MLESGIGIFFCHLTTIVIPNEINPISKWFAMSDFSVLVENCLVCSLVWEWRENRVWKGCLVTRICDILEHRGGHWSSSMKSLSAKSSRTLNPLSCDCGRHVDCV